MEISKPSKIVLIVFALILVFQGGILYQKTRQSSSIGFVPILNKSYHQPSGVDFSLFWDTWNQLSDRYVDKDQISTDKLVYGAISGMVNSLDDPYTVFLPPQENKEFNENLQGSFGGVGIEIGIREDILTVIAPITGSPADRAGIRAGDLILKIDEKSTDGMRVHEAVSKIRGLKGSSVTLAILHSGQNEPVEIKLLRDTIKIPTVSWKMQNDNVALLQVFSFGANVDREFKKTASEILSSKANRIILDLRNNPGGFLDSSVYLAGFFQDDQEIVTIKRGNGKEEFYRSEGKPTLKKYPIVILLNKGSASASEILAGALRDNLQALIVGETSFGKGSVQDVSQLSGGTSLKVTIAKWYTPSGATIDKVGIKPDIEVIRTDDDINNNRDPQLEKALEIINKL